MNEDRLERVDNLFEAMLQNKNDLVNNGKALCDLLDEFARGYPLKKLLLLINSDDEDVSFAGVWILAELGSASCPLFDEVKFLIDSKDPGVQFEIMSYFLICTGTLKDISYLYKLSKFLQYENGAVRSKAIDTFEKLSSRQIDMCVYWLKQEAIICPFARGFFLISDVDCLSEEAIYCHLKSNNEVMKKFAFIAALRMKLPEETIKKMAEISQDDDILFFVEVRYG